MAGINIGKPMEAEVGRCPTCLTGIDHISGVADEDKDAPTKLVPGFSVTVCMYCGEVLMYTLDRKYECFSAELFREMVYFQTDKAEMILKLNAAFRNPDSPLRAKRRSKNADGRDFVNIVREMMNK